MRQDITDIPVDRLHAVFGALGLKAYSASQVVRWLYKARATSFEEMTNLPQEARGVLREKFFIGRLNPVDVMAAEDGTKKFLFELADGNRIESVLIPSERGRVTLCISTEVGCAMGCAFCRTAKMGFVRDLSQGEILGQVLEVQRSLLSSDRPLTNIVLMGMGEPLVNYDAVVNAVKILLDERAFNLSKRRITVSTSGLVSQAERFVEQLDVKIAISLNATTDGVRDQLMPVNKRFSVADITKFCRDYSKRSRHRVTFEYVMIRDVNDTEEDMKRLPKLLTGINAKVNLIPFNPFPGSTLKAPYETTLKEWQNYLTNKGIQTNIRIGRGQDIMAACGQLAS